MNNILYFAKKKIFLLFIIILIILSGTFIIIKSINSNYYIFVSRFKLELWGNEFSLYKLHFWEKQKTALIIIDMWDNHWNKDDVKAMNILAKSLNIFIPSFRKSGGHIIYYPTYVASYYNDLYKHDIDYSKFVKQEKIYPWIEYDLKNIKQKFYYSKSKYQYYDAWTKINENLTINNGDLITENVAEVYGYLNYHKITNIFLAGVHLDACVFHRGIGILGLYFNKKNFVLLRDFTDVMSFGLGFNSEKKQFNKKLMIGYIEKHFTSSASMKNFFIK